VVEWCSKKSSRQKRISGLASVDSGPGTMVCHTLFESGLNLISHKKIASSAKVSHPQADRADPSRLFSEQAPAEPFIRAVSPKKV